MSDQTYWLVVVEDDVEYVFDDTPTVISGGALQCQDLDGYRECCFGPTAWGTVRRLAQQDVVAIVYRHLYRNAADEMRVMPSAGHRLPAELGRRAQAMCDERNAMARNDD